MCWKSQTWCENWSLNTRSLQARLRAGHRIRAILNSLTIYQNLIALEQVTAILTVKQCPASPSYIAEVKNLCKTYELTVNGVSCICYYASIYPNICHGAAGLCKLYPNTHADM